MFLDSKSILGERFSSVHVGVGHPIDPVSSVRGAEAPSRNINRPAGVVFLRQVSVNKVEPSVAVFSASLLAKDHDGSSRGNEPKELGPEMPLVLERFAPAGDREGLAGTGARPDGSVVSPSGLPKRIRPDPYPGEKVTLCIAVEISRLHVPDRSLVHMPGCNLAVGDQVAQPRRGVAVDLIVIGRHGRRLLLAASQKSRANPGPPRMPQ